MLTNCKFIGMKQTIIVLASLWWLFTGSNGKQLPLLQDHTEERLPTRDNGVIDIDKWDELEDRSHEILSLGQNSKTSGRRGLKQVDFEDQYGVFESIILTDDREPVKNTSLFPYSAIVHINFTCPSQAPERSQCSGTLIGPRTVLTAGHCIKKYKSEVDTTGEECTDFIVTPGKQNNVDPFGSTTVVKTIIPQNWDSKKQNYTFSDYGLMLLEDEIGRETGWMSISIDCFTTDYKEVVVAGYPADRPLYADGTTMVSSKCPVELNACRNNVSDGDFNHTCDTFGGQSGAPMWVINSNGIREIRGVHVRGTRDVVTGTNRGVYISVDAFLWIDQNKEVL